MKTFNPEHFRNAALAADEAAITACHASDDGGTCNFDTAVLHLPAEWQAQIEAALEGTGLTVSTRDWMCDPSELAYFVRSSRTGGQGAARTRAAEAIQTTFKAAGYQGLTYYQVD